MTRFSAPFVGLLAGALIFLGAVPVTPDQAASAATATGLTISTAA